MPAKSPAARASKKRRAVSALALLPVLSPSSDRADIPLLASLIAGRQDRQNSRSEELRALSSPRPG